MGTLQPQSHRLAQQLTADRPPGHRRPVGQATKSPASLAVCDLSQKQRNQFTSHRPDEHHHSQHQPPSLPRCSAGLRLLALHHPPYNRRRVSGRWWISWFTARGIGAAQTVWSEAASPSPTDHDPPAMLGKRTTQALVAQGIEHRFPNAFRSCTPLAEKIMDIFSLGHHEGDHLLTTG
jgi:hypothetical protein